MERIYPNLVLSARLSTVMSQERAAELLGLSPESLKQYEGGKTVPKDETVARMVEVYSCPWLALEHAQATDRLGVLPEVNVQSLPTAAITLINRVLDFAERHRDRQLLRIAEDGIIDERERPEFDAIVADLRETIAAAYQVIYADGAKKERPDGGTSKRSVSQADKPENDCINSIAHSRRNASPVLTKGVYAR